MRRRWWMVSVVVALLAIGAFWTLRSFGEEAVRTLVLREVHRAVPGEVEVGGVALSFVPPEVSFRNVVLYEASGRPVFSVSALSFELAVWASLWEGAWIGDLTIAEPWVRYRTTDGFWKALLDDRGAESESGAGSAFLPRRMVLRSGRLDVADPESKIEARIDAIRIDGQLSGLLQPAFSFDVSAHAVVERSDEKLTIPEIAIRGTAGGGAVRLERGRIRGDSGTVTASGEWTASAMQGEVDWDVRLDPLFALIPEAGVVRGAGRIRADIRGDLRQPMVSALLEARSVRIDDVVFSGTGALHADRSTWRLEKARAEIFGGVVDGEATGTLDTGIPYEVRGRFQGWDPEVFIRLFDVEAPVRGTWDGEAKLKGLLAGDDLDGGGSFSLRQSGRALTGEAQFAVAKDSAEVDGLLVGAPNVRLACRYRVEAGSIDGHVAVSGEDLRVLGPFLDLDLEGKGSIEGRFDGTLEEPIIDGRAELERIGLQGVSLGGVRGPFQIVRSGLQTTGLRSFDDRATLEGRIALTPSQENDWKARLDGVPVGDMVRLVRAFQPSLPPFSGDADGEIVVAGPWIGARLRSRLALRDLGVGDEHLGNVEAEATRAAGAWSVHAVLDGDAMHGGLDFGLSEAGALSGKASFAGKDLKAIAFLRARWPEIAGEFGLDASLRGTAARPEGEAHIALRNVEVAQEKIGDAALRLVAEGDRLSLDGGSGRLWRLRGTSTLRAPYPFEARGEWEDLVLTPFLMPEAKLEVRSSGNGRLEGNASSPFGSGELTIARLSIGREDLRITNPKPITLRLGQGVIELPEAVLEGGAERLVIRGRLGPQSEIVAEGTGSLALLETVLPGVASAQGQVRVQIRATRTGGQPWRYYGGGRIDDGALDLGFLVGITELAGELQFDERRAEVRNLTGSLGGGSFLVEGTIGFDEGWEVGWAFRDANLGVPEWLDYRAAGNGRLVGRFDHPTLTGEVEITQAVYDRRIEWGEFLPWFRREAQRSARDVSLPVDLELHVYADGGLFIDNNLAEAELQGSFDVRGSGESMTWPGRVDVLSGEFTFRRRQFTITSGSVQFLERRPLNPDLEFRGETAVATGEADYEIAVHVSGTAERPRIEFTADDPALSENDVLALVTFGRTVAQLQAQGAGIELTEVLALTAGPNAARVEERIYDLIPFDQIEIQPTFSRTTGTTEPRLSIGKDLTAALHALVSTGLGSERQQDVALEYELTPRISVQGIWESQTKSQAGAFGGDLKFRFPFRSFARFSLLPYDREGKP